MPVQLEYHLKAGDVLHWILEVTGNRDVGVGVRCGPHWAVASTRVDSAHIPIMGSVAADRDGEG